MIIQYFRPDGNRNANEIEIVNKNGYLISRILEYIHIKIIKIANSNNRTVNHAYFDSYIIIHPYLSV